MSGVPVGMVMYKLPSDHEIYEAFKRVAARCDGGFEAAHVDTVAMSFGEDESAFWAHYHNAARRLEKLGLIVLVKGCGYTYIISDPLTELAVLSQMEPSQ